jgi:hypothetical protein
MQEEKMEAEHGSQKEQRSVDIEENAFHLQMEHYPSTRGLRTPFIVVLTILLLLSGGGTLGYTFVYQPYTIRVHDTQLTATAAFHATTTAHMEATGTAESNATSTAQIEATNTVLDQRQNEYDQLLLRTPTFVDSLRMPDLYNWETDKGCTFTHSGYTITVSENHAFLPCFASNVHYSNFAYQVHVVIERGGEGGLAFHANATTQQSYLFTIGSDGSYHFYMIAGIKQKTAKNLSSGFSDFVTTGLQQDNTLTVIARKQHFDFYINGKYITSASDSTLSNNQLGVVASSSGTPTQVLFSQAEVWSLS